MCSRLTWLFFCLLPQVLAAASNYEILIPQMIRAGGKYQFSASTYTNTSQVFTPEFGIRTEKGISLVKHVASLFTDRAYSLHLNIPDTIPEEPCEFYFICEKILKINEKKVITINKKVHSLFIQTDKGLYKPGQKVLFRVIAIMPDLRAYKDLITITISDTAENKIKELKDMSSKNGVITSDLQLSDITPIGEWKITAETKFAMTEQFFKVAEYVLPKYEVTVNLPPFYHVNLDNPSLQEDLKATIIAGYTYGKPVKGVASVMVKLEDRYAFQKETQPTIKKVLKLEGGKADISLTLEELKKLLPSGWEINTMTYQTLIVEANVTETLTGNILSGDNTVPCKPNLYKIEFVPSTPDNFKPGLEYEAYLRVLKSDGSAPHECELTTSSYSYKQIIVETTISYPWVSKATRKPKTEKLVLTLDKHGYAFLDFVTDSEAQSISIKVSFLDEVSNSTVVEHKFLSKFDTRDKEGIKLVLLNADKIIKPRVKLSFEVSTLNPTTRYSLQVISKGNIVYTKNFKSVELKKKFYAEVNMSRRLVTQVAPEARFVVSYVTDKAELVADSLALNVVDYMTNQISLTFNKNVTKPGDKTVFLDVRTRRDSFVGLLGVDQSVLLMNKGNDITPNLVANELASYTNVEYNPMRPMEMGMRCFECDFWPNWLGGSNTDQLLSNAGLFALTDLHVEKSRFSDYPMMMVLDTLEIEAGAEEDVSKSPAAAVVTVRKDFPETFIWTDIVTDRFGKSRMDVKVPDTITSWIATGFSVSPSYGLGVTTNSAKLTVIKPFFISLNLPYSIIRGEEFALQANVFNYLGRDLEAEVRLLASKYFKVISCMDKSLTSKDVTKEIEVQNNDATAVYFWVVATELGHIPIEVRAMAGVAADAIKATLLVKPEGQPQSYTASELIQLKKGGTYEASFGVELPPKDILVLGSVVVEVTVIGDIMGSALNGIEDLLKMPYGCGEQNLLGFAPDVYILTYLKVSQRLTVVIKNKALNFLTSGYQRQLTYQRSDGSYSAFGQSDPSGSTWLSAFTIKCFHQAKDFIPVEDTKIAKTLTWIIKHQGKDGHYAEPPGGIVIHTNMQGGASSGIAMTAYVLISLLENKGNKMVNQVKFKESITKATTFLESTYNKYSSDPYALSIISYALFKAGSSKLKAVLDLLEGMAVTEGGLKHWKSKAEKPSNTWKSHYGKPNSYDVELASYVLLVYSQQDDLSKSLPIAKWLLTQRNAFGGFASTQDTVLGLEALASFSALIAGPTEGNGVTVSLKSDADESSHTFDAITQANALFLQSVQLPKESKKVVVSAKDAGVALVQLIVKYNIDAADINELLTLKIISNSAEKNLTLDLTTSWNGEDVSGMVVIEINILTGYTVLDETQLAINVGKHFKKMDKTKNKLVIYLDELSSEDLKFSVHLEELIPVIKVKPALVKVYRYYDSEYVASGFYTSSMVQTWQSACPLCC